MPFLMGMNNTDWANMVPNIIIYSLFAVITVGMLLRFFRNYLSKQKKVTATVIDKSATEYKKVTRSTGEFYETKYVVAFDAGGKTLRFFTSVWVYDSVEIHEKGVLRYQGDRFISFGEEKHAKSRKD